MLWHSARRQVCRSVTLLFFQLFLTAPLPRASTPTALLAEGIKWALPRVLPTVRWISQPRGFKPTCSLCLKQKKELLNKPFYQQRCGSSNRSIKGVMCRCKLAKSSNGAGRSVTPCLSIALQVHTSYRILHAQHLSMYSFYSAANTKFMQLHWKFFYRGLS